MQALQALYGAYNMIALHIIGPHSRQPGTTPVTTQGVAPHAGTRKAPTEAVASDAPAREWGPQ